MQRVFQESTLLRYRLEDKWIRLKVRNQRERWGHTFFCDRERMLNWLQGKEHTYLEMDGYSLLKAIQHDGKMTLTFFWFSPGSDGHLTGRMDTLYLEKNAFLEGLQADHTGSFFSYLHRFDSPSHFDFSAAQDNLRKVIADKRTRRALCKALAQRIGDYCGDQVQVYNDFRKSFYLVTTTRWGTQYNGGLVLHSGKKEGHGYVYYGFHT